MKFDRRAWNARPRLWPLRPIVIAMATAMLLCSPTSDALSQTGDDASGTTARLIQLLVAKGVLTKDQAADLLKEARSEGSRPRPARSNAAPTARAGQAQAPASTQQTPATAAAPPEPELAPGTVRVTYVPKAVRDQIASEVKDQLVKEEASNGGFAKPNAEPGWVQNIRITGDFRVRGERILFPGGGPSGGGNFDQFPDFQSINGLSNGYDSVSSTTNPPLLNTTENRTLFRIRARLDVGARITNWLDSDFRIGTGNDTSPVSLNQTFGQPGDFSKYNLWLDRAYLRAHPIESLFVDVGRAPNPFWTTNLLFSDSLNFDGISAHGDYKINDQVTVFGAGGAFPVYNTALNFGTASNTQPLASGSRGDGPSHDAYLFAAQAGAQYRINKDYEIKGGVGFFDFDGVQGKLSSPCVAPTAFGSCDTDNTRAPYDQFGNTMFALRSIVPSTSSTTTPSPQFYGLASRFEVLDVHGSATLHNFSPIDVVLDVDFIKNFGFNKARIASKSPANNLNSGGSYAGGDTGYQVSVSVGHQMLEKLWDWNATVAYKYLESDATLDALTDSDFHLGGTNAKGYVINGNLAVDNNVWVSGSWLSATQVSGPRYSVNVVLVDLNAKF